jgi:hypothetical protein
MTRRLPSGRRAAPLRLQLAALIDSDIAVNLAVNGRGLGLDLTADLRVFAHGQHSGRGDLAFDAAIDDELVLKLDRAFDFDVCGEEVFVDFDRP